MSTPLDRDGFRKLASRFGAVKRPAGRTRDGSWFDYDAELQIIDSGRVLTEQLREELADRSLGGLDPERPGLFETFHIDDAYVAEPASATILHARELPSSGGNTEFLDLQSAFLALEPELREFLRQRFALHEFSNRDSFPGRVSARGPAEVLAPALFPIVRTHPRTGIPGLFFDLDRATEVIGLRAQEGRDLLASLQHHAEAHGFRHQHRWQANDVLIWDNMRLQHRACGDFPLGEARRFWRHLIAGPRPF